MKWWLRLESLIGYPPTGYNDEPIEIKMSTPRNQMDPVQTYFERMAEIRSTGGATSETSYYSALENLLNELGKLLKPRVICNGQLRNQGAGHPDFGFYNENQCSKNVPKTSQGAIPERGVIEVKPLGDNSWQTAQGSQATKYLNQYGLVLVTNYREFRLIGEDDNGRPVERECFRLADDEATFWSMAAHPATTARQQGAHFREFLQRVMMNAAPLTRSEDIAWLLASYARDALTTLEEKIETTLAPLRTVLETALGMRFEDGESEHFFHSTLVQTLFYGIFSAWVTWAKDTSSKFDWKLAGYTMTVPMIRSLFEEVARPSRLEPLDLVKILDRTGEALNRIAGQLIDHDCPGSSRWSSAEVSGNEQGGVRCQCSDSQLSCRHGAAPAGHRGPPIHGRLPCLWCWSLAGTGLALQFLCPEMD